MRNCKIKQWELTVLLLIGVILVFPVQTNAANALLSVSGPKIPASLPVETSEPASGEVQDPFFAANAESSSSDIVVPLAVELPAVKEGDESPLNFILDPQGLLAQTNAARYGGGSVEEGATLYFRNHDGGYDFSGYSDWLTVTNQGIAPVHITVETKLEGLGNAGISADGSFEAYKDCILYLALIDSSGDICPFSVDESGRITAKLESMVSDVYSFRLTGACNPDLEWTDMSIQPVVTMTWTVEADAERE